MIMSCNINMYTWKILNQLNRDKLTYHFFPDDGFKNEECEFKTYNQHNKYGWKNITK